MHGVSSIAWIYICLEPTLTVDRRALRRDLVDRRLGHTFQIAGKLFFHFHIGAKHAICEDQHTETQHTRPFTNHISITYLILGNGKCLASFSKAMTSLPFTPPTFPSPAPSYASSPPHKPPHSIPYRTNSRPAGAPPAYFHRPSIFPTAVPALPRIRPHNKPSSTTSPLP